MREIKQWSQEEMADKLNISTNSYSKMERGKTKLNFEKLEQISNIFQIDIVELIASKEKSLFFLVGDNNKNNACGNETLIAENEKLHLIIKHKEDFIGKLNDEIIALKEIIRLLKNE